MNFPCWDLSAPTALITSFIPVLGRMDKIILIFIGLTYLRTVPIDPFKTTNFYMFTSRPIFLGVNNITGIIIPRSDVKS